MRCRVELLITLVVIHYAFFLCAQNQEYIAQNNIDRISDSGISNAELLMGLPPPAPRVMGTAYLRDTTWNKGEFTLTANDRHYDNILMRYNLYSNQLEIATDRGARTLGLNLLKSFGWVGSDGEKRSFISLDYLKGASVSYTGIGEVIYTNGDRKLVERFYMFLKKPTYSPQLDVGSRDSELIQKSELLFIEDGKVIFIKRTVMSLSEVFKIEKKEMSSFVKKNKLKLSERDDLIRVVEHFKI